MKNSYDVVVIGSGFGGAITACRLAEAGFDVCILERGKQYEKGEFPRDFKRPEDWFWNDKLKGFHGFSDFRFYRDIGVLVGSGVGGTSLIYANVHLRAPQEVFEKGWPAAINRQVLDPYYDRVAQMLNISPLPEHMKLPKTEAMHKAAEMIGKGDDWEKPDLAICWGEEGKEKQDPYDLSIDAAQTGCQHTGECAIGCNILSKNTLDLNYIPLAIKNGAECFPLHQVSKIAPAQEGYRVYYKDLGQQKEGSVAGKAVILAAGALGSTELFLRCKNQYETLPGISQKLGQNFSGNGDFLAFALNTKGQFADLQPWNGPSITTVIKYEDQYPEFYLEEGGLPMKEWAWFLAALRPDADYFANLTKWWLRPFFNWRFKATVKRLFMEATKKKTSASPPSDLMVFLLMGRDAADGRMQLKRPFPFFPKKFEVRWDNEKSMALFNRMSDALGKVSAAMGGELVFNPTWQLCERLITVHPLGGCPLGDRPEEGVVDQFGEVYNYPDLYVADGAIVPTAIGPNPAMTIGALAERISEQIIKKS